MRRQLLILPGWSGSKESWKNFISLAQADYEVHCLDLPCFGQEPCPTEIWGVEEYGNFVLEKIKRFNLSQPILLGHSFGGAIAAYLAANHPERFSRLILSGPAIFRRTSGFKKYSFLVMAKFGKFIFAWSIFKKFSGFMKKLLYRLANSDYNDTSGIKREIYKKITGQDLSETVKKINLPTLIIWGEKDGYVPVKQSKKLAALINGSNLELILNGKHGLHLQMPERLYGLVKNFIK